MNVSFNMCFISYCFCLSSIVVVSYSTCTQFAIVCMTSLGSFNIVNRIFQQKKKDG